MIKTEDIKLDWINSAASKFGSLKICESALVLINKSESLKSDIRAYAGSDANDPAAISMVAGSAAYNLPSESRKGFLSISADQLSSLEKTLNVLAHELGHFRVEALNAVAANARRASS